MKEKQQIVESANHAFITSLGSDYPWHWEPRLSMCLSEFASNKQAFALTQLQQYFNHQWDHQTIKKAPKAFKQQLAELSKLKPGQQIFMREATQTTPALLALWWPWGHGGTISLRLTTLPEGFQYQEAEAQHESFFSVVKKLFS